MQPVIDTKTKSDVGSGGGLHAVHTHTHAVTLHASLSPTSPYPGTGTVDLSYTVTDSSTGDTGGPAVQVHNESGTFDFQLHTLRPDGAAGEDRYSHQEHAFNWRAEAAGGGPGVLTEVGGQDVASWSGHSWRPSDNGDGTRYDYYASGDGTTTRSLVNGSITETPVQHEHHWATATSPSGSVTTLYDYNHAPPLGPAQRGWFSNLVNFSAGMGDAISCGLTRRIRQGLGYDDVVDAESGWYTGGQVAGEVMNIALAPVNPCNKAKWIAGAIKGMSAAQTAGQAINVAGALQQGDLLAAGLNGFGARVSFGKLGMACFAAGTPIRTPDGSKPVEDLRPGDLVLTRAEFDPEGPVVARPVLQTITNAVRLLHLHVGDQVIRTTAEHPFYARGRGWVAAGTLVPGDELLTEGGGWERCGGAVLTAEVVPVFNVEVADHHTYFVGEAGGAAVWAHNECAGYHHFWLRSLGNRIPYKDRALTYLNAADHTAVHSGLRTHLAGVTKRLPNGRVVDMLPRRGRPGPAVVQNFSRTERFRALADFYRNFQGGRYLNSFLNEVGEARRRGLLVK